jgi:glutathione S-transferase
MITFHHSPRSRSTRLVWLCEELGLPYEARPIEFERRRTPDYLALHPLGQIPVMQDGDITLIESGAIVQYVLERHGDGRLAPRPGSDWRARAEYLQWFEYGEATLAKHLGDIVRHRFVLPEAERIPAVIDQARRRFAEAAEVVDRALAGRDFICGAELTGADIMIAYAPALAKITGELPKTLTNLSAYLRRLRERPAYAKAWS